MLRSSVLRRSRGLGVADAVLALGLLALLAATASAQPVAEANGSASPGRAFFWVPRPDGKYHVSRAAHVTFQLPSGRWVQVRSGLTGARVTGSYRRTVSIRGNTCAVTLIARGNATHSRPDFAKLLPPPVRVTGTGSAGHVEWATGVAGGLDIAYAFSLTPRRFAPSGKPWTLYTLDLVNHRGASIPKCRRWKSRIDLRHTITSLRLTQGALPTRPLPR